jgi:hypothetical protein
MADYSAEIKPAVGRGGCGWSNAFLSHHHLIYPPPNFPADFVKKGATVLGTIPASSDTVESEVQNTKQA